MRDDHLDPVAMERALRGEVPALPLLRGLLAHAIALCPRCRKAWRQVSLPQRQRLLPAASPYGEAFARVLERVRRQEPDLRAEMAQAEELVAELVQAPEVEQLQLLREEPRFHRWGVCNFLLREVQQAIFEDPETAEGLAGLAVEVAVRLDPAVYGAPFLADVQALAWAHLGNARRVRSDLRGAQAAFDSAERFLTEGVGEPLTRAQVLGFQASLRRDQRRFEESQQLLEEVIRIYRQVGDGHLEGRTLLNKASAYREAGMAAGAVPLLRRALTLIDPAIDERLLLCAFHNLALALVDNERYAEAAAELARAAPLYAKFPDFSTRQRLRWLEGKLAMGLDRAAEAETAFEEVRQGFLEKGIGYDAALVSLDLALLHAGAGRFDEVQRLAEEMYPVFQSREVHREALAALLVFQHAARTGALTLAIVEHVAAFLRRARRDPTLRFEEPS